MSLVLTVTNAGRAALVNAQNTGTAPVLITQCGITETAVVPAKTATALPGEIKRIATISGDVVADDTIHLVIRDQSPDDYSARGLALYLGDGTLFAIYGQADPIVSKTAASMMMLAIDVRFEDIDATSLTFGDANFLNPPATTEVQGVVELATVAEATAGTDPVRATTPKSVKDAVTAWLDSRFGADNALVWNPNNDGAGSGLDADMLDGLQAAAFLLASAYTAADVRAKLLTVDGAGSGIDADLLDGLHGADFAQLGPAPTTTGAGMSLDLNLINKSGWYTAATTSNGPGNNTTVILHVERAFAAGQTAMQLAVNQNGHLAFRSATGAGGGRVWSDWGQVWTAVNDGAGSGLDADMLDGLHAADFVGPDSLGAYTAHRVATARGGYYGISFGADADSSAVMFNADGKGGLYHRGTSTWIAYWNGTDLHIGAAANANKAWHAANDGAGSGLDADLLDGLHAAAFLLASAYTAADVRTKLLTMDGAGSGLDADMLDGLHAAAFVLASAYTAADVRTKLLTVDGAGSGLDADLLDGYHGSSYDRVTSQSLVENGGYLIYASGRKECWGYVDVAKDVTVTVTLPTVHSSWVNPIVSATATGIDQTDNAGISSIVSANQFRITNGNVAHRLYWRSIGV